MASGKAKKNRIIVIKSPSWKVLEQLNNKEFYYWNVRNKGKVLTLASCYSPNKDDDKAILRIQRN